MTASYLARWEVAGVGGTVVAIDVVRAFTTAAYAFDAGAVEIWLVAGVQEAIDLAATMPGALIMGEDHGARPDGFDFSNSPVAVSRADLHGRSIVQRTSAGTAGVVAAVDAERLFASSLRLGDQIFLPLTPSLRTFCGRCINTGPASATLWLF